MKGNFFSRMTERTLGTAPTVHPVIPSRFSYGPMEHSDNIAEFADQGQEEKFNSLNDTETVKYNDRGESKVLPEVVNGQTSHPTPLIPQEHHLSEKVEPNHIEAEKPLGKKTGEPASLELQVLEVKTPGKKQFAGKEQQLLVPKKKKAHEMTESRLGPKETTVERIRFQLIEEKTKQADVTSHRTSMIYPKDQPYQFQNSKKQQEKSASEAPTIRVTIGRIEVRAVTTPQPSRRPVPKKTAPSLSLDDYLKQRSEGRR